MHRNNSGFYLRNSIIAGDMPEENCVGSIGQSIGNLAADASCNPRLGGDALLGELTGEPAWHPPGADSPAIDAAEARFCPAADQAGNPRPMGAGYDIGAIEAAPVVHELSDRSLTTTHALNFRAGPGGNRIGLVAQHATVNARSRTVGWFQVEYMGRSGWISADYVVTEGECV